MLASLRLPLAARFLPHSAVPVGLEEILHLEPEGLDDRFDAAAGVTVDKRAPIGPRRYAQAFVAVVVGRAVRDESRAGGFASAEPFHDEVDGACHQQRWHTPVPLSSSSPSIGPPHSMHFPARSALHAIS